MLNEFTRRYLLDGLRHTPNVLAHVLAPIVTEAPSESWDRRPVADRFTLREVLAHLADWDTVWRERLELILTEDTPYLPDRDPEQLARDRDYGSAHPTTSLERFQTRRAELVERLRHLNAEAWGRTGQHQVHGAFTVADLAATALGHDSYHLAQAAEWIRTDPHHRTAEG